ncbi:MAG: hypothetical protein AVDCRST_MAG57-1945, partial [uncultured Blastococcus sp.]
EAAPLPLPAHPERRRALARRVAAGREPVRRAVGVRRTADRRRRGGADHRRLRGARFRRRTGLLLHGGRTGPGHVVQRPAVDGLGGYRRRPAGRRRAQPTRGLDGDDRRRDTVPRLGAGELGRAADVVQLPGLRIRQRRVLGGRRAAPAAARHLRPGQRQPALRQPVRESVGRRRRAARVLPVDAGGVRGRAGHAGGRARRGQPRRDRRPAPPGHRDGRGEQPGGPAPGVDGVRRAAL